VSSRRSNVGDDTISYERREERSRQHDRNVLTQGSPGKRGAGLGFPGVDLERSRLWDSSRVCHVTRMFALWTHSRFLWTTECQSAFNEGNIEACNRYRDFEPGTASRGIFGACWQTVDDLPPNIDDR